MNNKAKVIVAAVASAWIAFALGYAARGLDNEGEASAEVIGFAHGRLCESHCRLHKRYAQDGEPAWFVDYEREFNHDPRCDCSK